MTLQFDNNPAWNTNAMPLNNTPTSLMTWFEPSALHQFVHEFTSSSVLHVSFGGNEPTWTIPLAGTTAVWPQFQTCLEMLAPSVAAAITAVPVRPSPSSRRALAALRPGRSRPAEARIQCLTPR